MDASDQTLIDRFLDGDREAFGTIVARWERPVLNLAHRLTGDLEEALDIRQAAFVKAFRGLPAFNGSARFSTWLHRIVVNLSRDRMRARRSREAALRRLTDREPAGAAPSAGSASERREAARIVAGAVAALPEREREVVILRHYHGLSFPEIALIVGAPASTVKSWMSRGLQNLRARLKSLED
jgi:RNA polymerase sigma-70 factor (ECF subfamily)